MLVHDHQPAVEGPARRPPRAATVLAVLVAAAVAPAQEAPVDFNRDIRPLLSDRCFKCHGFDAQQRKAGLRLDTREGLTTAIEGRRPVVPGDPDASELMKRITEAHAGRRMPPVDSGLTLDAEEIALLRQWIAEGAPHQRHWAFEAPRAGEVPGESAGSWARGPLDRFIADKLAKARLNPSPEASKGTLIRRVSLDLTGLPPTPEEIATFFADRRPDAYERLVDRLLASPRFGERMALMWLDVARYADTNGYHHDNIRTGWPYRDWVIDAFNDNLPFDQFVIHQLAGDLLPDATDKERIATAFCRMHNINDEGGALDAEYRIEAVADRIETIATGFMGLTFTCSRCHDHKYDPFTQEDYYSFAAYFNSVEERGVYARNFEQARAYPARITYTPPDVAERKRKVEAAIAAAKAELDASGASVIAELEAWESEYRNAHGIEWVTPASITMTSRHGDESRRLEDGSFKLTGKGRDRDTLTFALETEATGMRLIRVDALTDPEHGKKSFSRTSHGNAVISAITAVAISKTDPTQRRPVELTWAWADHEQPNGDFDVLNVLRPDDVGWALDGHRDINDRTAILVAREAFGFEGGTRVEVSVACESGYARHVVGRSRVAIGKATDTVLTALPVVMSDWFMAGPFTGRFDELFAKPHGPEAATGVPTSKDVQWKHRPDIVDGKVNPLRGQNRAWYFGRSIRTPVARKLPLSLGSDDAIAVFLNGQQVHANKALRGAAPDQEKVTIDLPAGESTLVVKIVNAGGPGGMYFRADPGEDIPDPLMPVAMLPQATRGQHLNRIYRDRLASKRSPTYARLSGNVATLEAQLKAIDAESVPVLVMRELPKPTPTFVLTRGNYASPDETRPVKRRTPEALMSLPGGMPKDRLGFAKWLVHEDHPLTARVHVNRIWQMIFGTGIVATVEDFGHQAAWPSHQELLDWLAVEFVRSGWDQKALIRRIVTSATYRQSSRKVPEAVAKDPDNRLLASFPRRRLPGEMIRDQALFAAGLLVERIGGPSVRPYQPAGLWREVSIGGNSNTQIFKQDTGDGLYRRSLYTFWKRTSPNPQMATFDAPTREFCVVRRGVTNTPLQALVLWNDVQFVEASRVLAQRSLTEPDEQARMDLMFLRTTGRTPDRRERLVLNRALAGFKRRYADAPDDARKLIAVGDAPLPEDHDPSELAAWTMIANTILSLDATVVRN